MASKCVQPKLKHRFRAAASAWGKAGSWRERRTLFAVSETMGRRMVAYVLTSE